jgi:hypothetical protein
MTTSNIFGAIMLLTTSVSKEYLSFLLFFNIAFLIFWVGLIYVSRSKGVSLVDFLQELKYMSKPLYIGLILFLIADGLLTVGTIMTLFSN